MKPLRLGAAYHGNRMPSHVKQDMREIAKADMDIVVHMLSHTDWDRHKNIMKENFCSILIDAKYKKSIMRELDQVNINEAFLFPEPEYTAKRIKNRYIK